ncbi:MAG: hypothetical protein JSS00_09035 [Proteobacteria bacterium]|nr:hypothetical protein [Pseudomonadota bacterium]
MKAMTMFSKVLIALAACGLAACGQGATPGASAPQGQAGANNNNRVVLQSTQNLPDWLLVARQRDCSRSDCVGEVLFNQRTITRNPDGTADIWLEVRHANPQAYPIETATTRTTITYTNERLHYRFKCAEGQFTVLERQIMGVGETVVAHDNPRPIYRAPADGSVTPVVMPIACTGR